MSELLSLLSVDKANAVSAVLEVPSSAISDIGVQINILMDLCKLFVGKVLENGVSKFPSIASFHHLAEETITQFTPVHFGFPSQYTNLFPLMNPKDILLLVIGFVLLWFLTQLFSRLVLGSRYNRLTIIGVLLYPLLAAGSLYIFLASAFAARGAGYHIWNNASGTTVNEQRLTKIWWCFLVLQIVEWEEALWVVLRYKHKACFFDFFRFATALPLAWFIGIVSPAGDTYFFVLVSSGVQFILCINNAVVLALCHAAKVSMQRDLMNRVLATGILVKFLAFGSQFLYDFIYLSKKDQRSNPLSVLLPLAYTTALLGAYSLSFSSNYDLIDDDLPSKGSKKKKTLITNSLKSPTPSLANKKKGSKVEGRTKAQEKEMKKKMSVSEGTKKKQ